MCSEPECVRPSHARGVCKSHYWSKYLSATGKKAGGLPPRNNWTEDEYEAFWQFVKKELKLV